MNDNNLSIADVEKLPLPVCRNCGKEFKPHDYTTIFCSRKCYDDYRCHKPKVNVQPQGKPLSEWINEAAQCNLDYGTYRGLIAQGKSFEELKAQADTRNAPTHNHAPYGFLTRQRSF